MKFLLVVIASLIGFTSHGQYFSAQKIKVDKNRQIMVYLPDNYKESRLRYPVIYVFDGEMLFDLAVSSYRYNRDIYPPAIIVGIEQINRGNELIEKGENNPGGNEFFYTILQQKIFPLIENRFRTNSIRIGIGHSHGGSFVLHAALGKDFFNAVVSISPTLWTNHASFLKNYPPESPAWNKIKKFYCAYGDGDFPAIQKDVEFLFENREFPVHFKKTMLIEEDHNSAVLTGMRKGLDFIFNDFNLSEEAWEKIEDLSNDTLFYAHFKRLFGFWQEHMIPGEDDYNSLGYYYLENSEWEKAEKTFKEALFYYPFSANLYDSLGELYEKQQRVKEARRYYLKALKMARKDKELQGMIPTYEEHLKSVK